MAQLTYGTLLTNYCFYSILFACNQYHSGVLLIAYKHLNRFLVSYSYVFQNSPEVDEEGYSIRPDEESEEADILNTAFLFVMLQNCFFFSFFKISAKLYLLTKNG